VPFRCGDVEPFVGFDQIADRAVAAGRKGDAQIIQRGDAALCELREAIGDQRRSFFALDDRPAASFDTGKLHCHSPQKEPVGAPDDQELLKSWSING
jgi:hypothetical protein